MCISISLRTCHTLCSYAICVMLMSEYSHKLNVHSRHCNLYKFPCQRNINFFCIYLKLNLQLYECNFQLMQIFSDLNCSKHGSKLIKTMFGVAEIGCIDLKQQFCGVYIIEIESLQRMIYLKHTNVAWKTGWCCECRLWCRRCGC